jgi:Tc toxin complex TcA C-terminal TcB-binding domain/Neuraminidase-like domain
MIYNPAVTPPTPSLSLNDVYWKTPLTTPSTISPLQLLPLAVFDICKTALTALKKGNLLIATLHFSADEINYLHNNKDFDSLDADSPVTVPMDFNNLTLLPFLRLVDYCNLRNSLSPSALTILDFWKWINDASAPASALSAEIEKLSSWKKEDVESLISSSHFNLDKQDFKNEQTLLQMQKALQVAAGTGMDITTLFGCTILAPDFDKYRSIASTIQNAIRARYSQSDWEQVIKPLNDQLRNNQKNALIAYLLQYQTLKNAGVTDADGLFEYFLIDVQMDTCMETSRIKQAISSVQLFIQRCFMGLEKENNISPMLLDRERWEWMERYRVWEANRKIFLYPENWIEGNLRDDKSPFFKELESELLQKDINKQNVTDALKTYLYKVDDAANMEVVGVYIEGERKNETSWDEGAKLHVFSRTRTAPYFFYYRFLALDELNWYPWEKMQVDIPSYDTEDLRELLYNKYTQPITYSANPDYKKILGNGCYLTPLVWNKRLFIFFPQFVKKTKPNEDVAPSKSIVDISSEPTDGSRPVEYWEIKMAWSEYRNGKWTQKQLSKDAVDDIPPTNGFWKAYYEFIKAKAKLLDANRIRLKKYKVSDDKWQTYSIINSAPAPGGPNSFQAALAYDSFNNAYHDRQEADRDFTKATNEKQAASDNLATFDPPLPANDISKYEFVPVASEDGILVAVKVYYAQVEKGLFEFDGSNFTTHATKLYPYNNISYNLSDVTRFHHNQYSSIRSLQINNYVNSHIFSDKVNTTYTFVDETYLVSDHRLIVDAIKFYHPDAHSLLGVINAQEISAFFNFHNSKVSIDKNDVFGGYDHDHTLTTPNWYHELKRPYSLYNWELFFHTPMMIADTLSKAQQFEEAMKWFHYVFNPIADGPVNDDKRFWQFIPFKEIDSKKILEQIFKGLKGNTANTAISEWRNNPFKPHLVARNRPVAYMKWVVMKYIDNILDWGDYLFRQDTIESINQATQLYVLAGHILGRRPALIPKPGEPKPQTYRSLLGNWDAFSNAMSEIEMAVAYGIQPANTTMTYKVATPTTDVYGSVGALYFCIPNNPKLLGYWDTLADRLFKIRQCQNIEGVFRKLPLFEPPIDPALLVKAAAQGLSISSVINDVNSPMPNYRFYYLLQKAQELCGELKSLGGSMLSAIEKKDNESISLLRARHEGTMNNMMMEIKKLQLEESKKSLESLYQNRKAPEAKMKYYLQLIGEDADKLPGLDSDFAELGNSIEKPIDESGLRLSKFEKEDIDKATEAAEWQIGIGIVETLASVFHALPTLSADGKPFGIGAGVMWGFPNLANATTALGRGLKIHADHLSYQSSHAAKKGGFQRALQERIMQANAAGFEIKQIDKQITSQQIRINIANQEIANQQKQIDNSNEVEDFLKNKYSNEELYNWMRGNLKTLYRQVYNLAFDLAKKAEKTYCFEKGISNASFIQPGYFDAGREGLLAGEQLYVGLKQLEAAHQEKRGYDYEITKHISLRQLNPLALIQLKSASKCEFDLPEALFDMDYPGHFKRRIKSVSVSIPCIAGPYTGVNATLRLLSNKFRNSSISNSYPEKIDGSEERFISYNIPVTAIATSSGQNDAGVFELNFKDERYLPFEGAGAISRWSLELPSIKQFNYNTIADVILHVKFTASEGGEQLKTAAISSVISQLNNQEGLVALIDLKHDMPNEWNVLLKKGSTNIKINKSSLSYLAQGQNAVIAEVMFIAKLKSQPPSFEIGVETALPHVAGAIIPTTLLSRVEEWKLYRGSNSDILLDAVFNLSVPSQVNNLEELVMVVMYGI